MAELDWDDLRYLLRALEVRSLAGAGRAMGVKHSTVGRRLAALERALDATLVLRRPDGLLPTPLGEKALARLEEVERAVNAFHELVKAQRTRVRAAVPSGMSRLLASQLARLHREHPEISVELLSGSRVVSLARGEADFALRIGAVAEPDLVVRRLGTAGMALYASDAYLARHPAPSDPRDLAGHELIGFFEGLAATPASRWLEEHARGATIVLRCREMTELVAAAAGGTGIALLPCWIAEAEPSLRRLTPDVVLRREVALVYRREVRLAGPVRLAMRAVEEAVKAHAAALRGTSA